MRNRIVGNGRFNARLYWLAITICFVFSLAADFRAEQLPLRHYTSADGLISSAVTGVSRDSRGFIWFTTRDGLSRFDGYEFVNFRINDQASGVVVWNLLETRDGNYWISTNEGLYRANPNDIKEVKVDDSVYKTGEPMKLKADKVADIIPSVIFEDSKNRLWGADGDLFLIAENGSVDLRKIDLGKQAQGSRENPAASSIAETPDGSLWIVCFTGVARRLPDGKVIFYPVENQSAYAGTSVIRADDRGRVWFTQKGGLFTFFPEPLSEVKDLPDFSSRPTVAAEKELESSGTIFLPDEPGTMLKINKSFSPTEPLQDTQISGIFQSSDKKIWIAAREDLYVIEGENYRRLRDTRGFPEWTEKFVEDKNGDLWIGTSGALRFARNGLTSFGLADGLLRTNVQRVLQNADGSILAIHGGDWRISKITEKGIETKKLKMPESAKILWASNAGLLDDDRGWWALADTGLYHFSGNKEWETLGSEAPSKVYSIENGLKSNSFYCAFKDSKGNLWFSSRGTAETSGLMRYDRATGKFKVFNQSDGYPDDQSPVSFAEDKAGNLWFGLYGGGLVKYSNEKFTDLSKTENFPEGSIFGLYFDEKNRLWLGSSIGGVARVDDVSAANLEFVKYTTAEGLSSNNIRTLIGDLQGNIYAGTIRGINRISSETGTIIQLTTADGLAADFVTSSFRDGGGTIWFGTTDGVSKLVPQKEVKSDSPAPEIWISNLSIAGNHYSVSEFGQKEIGLIEASADQNNLQIGFLSVGANLRFEYKLEGAENGDWSEPTTERRVNFANLAPDSYKFLVRAVNEFGQTSENPAVISFKINPPFYRSWWFLTLLIAVLAAAIFALDRYRVSKTNQVKSALAALQRSKEERLAELEKVRTRIATDLHDDIGASLTQIAVLSEVVRSQNAAPQFGQKIHPLESITSISNELVETMSDIVWAINPRKDNLRDLVQRMRRFAADVLSARKIKFEFDAPDIASKLGLGANLRREIFAIYKECINNIVKHSEATVAEVSLSVSGDHLQLKISDNGRGFDQEKFLHDSYIPGMGGNGLHNIERRARDLGGKCTIISSPGNGTGILLELPLVSDEKEKNFTSQTGSENGNGKSVR